MSTAEYYSNLAMVTSAVLYLLALICHAAEWASARQVGGARATEAATGSEQPDSTPAQASTGTDGSAAQAGRPGQAATAGARRPAESGSDGVPGAGMSATFGRIGLAVTMVAVLVHVGAVGLRGVAAQRAPWGNMYEFITASLAMAAVIYLVGVFAFRLRGFGLPFTLLASVGQGLAVTVFYVDVAPLMPALHSVWFVVHIAAAALAGAALNVAAITSALYLLKLRALRRGCTGGALARVPEPAALDRLSYRLHAFAFPLWTFAIIAGSIWAQFAWGRFWGWDPKETWSLVTWIVYAAYLHARSTAGWKGKRAAVLALVGIASFWWNFVGVNLVLDGLHSYAGI